MSIRFTVDKVKSATERCSTRSLSSLFPGALSLALDPARPVIESNGAHPLLFAIHKAFSEHRPLVLSPDHIWLTIAQGVAQHVRLNAEHLRPRLIRHQGKKRIELYFDQPSPPAAAESWGPLVDQFREVVASEIGQGLGRLFVSDFSTTGEVERIASEIVLLDAFSPYFDYYLYCICGIPEITLLGTPEDWRKVRKRLDVVRELDLGWWVDDLIPLADAWICTAEGNVDRPFWQAIYKPAEVYGGERITGWIARLFPYLKENGAFTLRNPLLGTPLSELPKSKRGMYEGPGVLPGDVPSAISCARIRCVSMTGKVSGMALEGGLFAVEEDGEGRLVPLVGYAVQSCPATAAELIASLPSEIDRNVTGSEEERSGLSGLSAELVELYSEIRSGLIRFPRSNWRILPLAAHADVTLVEGNGFGFRRIVDLDDGTYLAHSARGWTRARQDRAIAVDGAIETVPRQTQSHESPSTLPWLGESLGALLEEAALHGGLLEERTLSLEDRFRALFEVGRPKKSLLWRWFRR